MIALSGLGDPLTDLLSTVGQAATPAIQAEAEQILVPIIAPYAIALVALSVAGLLFGVTAYSNVKRLRQELTLAKKRNTAAKAAAATSAPKAAAP